MGRLFSNQRWRWMILIAAAVVVVGGLTFGGIAVFANRAKKAAEACPVTVPSYSIESGQVAISEADNGQTIDIKSGNQLVVVVKYIPADGFGWELREISNPELLSKVDAIFNKDGVWTTYQAGVPAYESWIFKANQSGTTQLSMDYSKTEDGTVTVDRSLRVTVNVQ